MFEFVGIAFACRSGELHKVKVAITNGIQQVEVKYDYNHIVDVENTV